ncbi:MAG: phosphatase PAP2 family protein [Planctomycetota bacterium]
MMTTDPKRDSRPIRWGVVIAWGVALLLFALGGHALDDWGQAQLRGYLFGAENAFELDWQRLLRIQGSVITWCVVGLCFVLMDWGKRPALHMKDAFSRGALVVISGVLGGLFTEGLKIVLRRERPEDDGEYIFRPWSDGSQGEAASLMEALTTSGLGLPSSHAGVAAGALFALSRIHPRLTILCVFGILGCAMMRVQAGAHFISDTAVGIAVGVAAAWVVWRAHLTLVYGGKSQEQA